MLIRTQDKKILYNLKQCTSIGIRGDVVVMDDAKVLGFYETVPKAVKVLDMIAAWYDDSSACSSIFQMPEDDEVRE